MLFKPPLAIVLVCENLLILTPMVTVTLNFPILAPEFGKYIIPAESEI